jgi:pilus assembly protein CpaC
MTKTNILNRATIGTALAAVLAAGLAATAPVPANAQQLTQTSYGTYRPTRQVLLSVGEGQMISLPRNVVDIWTSNSEVADVNVNSPRQIGLFGKAQGEATIIATASDGTVVFGAQVRVSQNITSIDEMMRAAMPDSNIKVVHVGQMAVINGTVASPEDSAQAEALVRSMLNPGIDTSAPGAMLKIVPVNRLKTATPLQVMLQVKIAEVNRSLVKELGVNLDIIDPTGGAMGFVFGRGRDFGDFNADGATYAFQRPTSTGSAGVRLNDLFGLNGAGAVDLNENNGLVTILAEPNLTAISGETASFLAGGEFPIPVSQSLGAISIEYKNYGVGLAFTPTVLADGRISMRVRPEVSELSNENSIRLNGFNVPALTTRRAETTVELGSGQSMMIAGLLRNAHTNSVDKTPWLGDVPILGALFRSTSFRRAETELVIVVTPYLVKPVSASRMALPTDGYNIANDTDRFLMGETHSGVSGATRPGPVIAPPRTVAPAIGVIGSAALPQSVPSHAAPAKAPVSKSAAPGFSFK